jgi:hypothetical protein
MNVMERIKSPTPKFFRIIRNVGLTLVGISASIIALPAAIPTLVLPAIAVKIAGFLAVAGTVASGVSQTAVEGEQMHKPVE